MKRSAPKYGLSFIVLLAVAHMLLAGDLAHAQNIFKGTLFNKTDSAAIPAAAVTIKEIGTTQLTNDKGEFTFNMPADLKQITVNVYAIGIKNTLTFNAPFNKTQDIYLDVSAGVLNEVTVKGLSAEEVVRIAVASIPANYADSSYFDYSFYRRYQKVDGRYQNLFEACPAVMFRLTRKKQQISSKEAFAIKQLRRTKFHPNISNVIEDNPADLLVVNPVYHLEPSSLYPGKFASYNFTFDTSAKFKDYVVKYICNNFSSDTHGVQDYTERDLKGELWETGELVIDRVSFAIKKIHRVSHRHQDYHYRYFPPYNNGVTFSHRLYLFEFVAGDMIVEYEEVNHKWYLNKMARQYTDEFHDLGFGTIYCTITDNFEWYSGHRSHYTTNDYAGRFYSKMGTAIHTYDTAFWSEDKFPFYYTDKQTIYQSLLLDGPLEDQFYNETLVDEIKKPKK